MVRYSIKKIRQAALLLHKQNLTTLASGIIALTEWLENLTPHLTMNAWNAKARQTVIGSLLFSRAWLSMYSFCSVIGSFGHCLLWLGEVKSFNHPMWNRSDDLIRILRMYSLFLFFIFIFQFKICPLDMTNNLSKGYDNLMLNLLSLPFLISFFFFLLCLSIILRTSFLNFHSLPGPLQILESPRNS